MRDFYLLVGFSKSPFIALLLPPFYSDDDHPGGRVLEKGASIEDAELPLSTTLLLSSDVLMTKFSLGIDWSILRRGKV